MISLKNARKVFRGADFETVALDGINLESIRANLLL